MSYRNFDARAEKELSAFLDKYFYSKLLGEGRFSSFSRMTGKEHQLQGIDVIGRYGSSEIYVDEKAQLHYINRPLPTFALELSFLSNGDERIGWFMNDSLKTTHYLFLWPNARVSDFLNVRESDFTYVEAMLIPKKGLADYLDDIGLDRKALNEINSILRQQDKFGPRNTAYDGIKLYMSPLSEKPINLVINKKHFLNVPGTVSYLISRSGFERKRVSGCL